MDWNFPLDLVERRGLLGKVARCLSQHIGQLGAPHKRFSIDIPEALSIFKGPPLVNQPVLRANSRYTAPMEYRVIKPLVSCVFSFPIREMSFVRL